MLSCRRANALVSDRMDRRLTLRERMSLALHLMICSGCRRASKQFRRMQQATERGERLDAPPVDGVELRLDEGARARISRELEDAGERERGGTGA